MEVTRLTTNVPTNQSITNIVENMGDTEEDLQQETRYHGKDSDTEVHMAQTGYSYMFKEFTSSSFFFSASSKAAFSACKDSAPLVHVGRNQTTT